MYTDAVKHRWIHILAGLAIAVPAFAGSFEDACFSAPVRSFADLRCCFGVEGGPQACLDRKLPALSAGKTPRALLDEMDEAGGSEPLLAEKCHFVAHAIGRLAGRMSPSFADAYRACDYRCQAGCIHGVIEQLFFHELRREHFTIEDLRERIPTVCDGDAVGKGRAERIECTHGLGHAVLSGVDYDLPAALRGCDLVPDREGRLSCQLGVFMENIITDETELRNLKADDPLYPCDAVDPAYRAMCYTEQPKALLARGLKPEAIASLCALLGSDADRCFEGLGRDTSLELRLGKFSEVAAVCERSAGDHLRACVTGAAMASIDLAQDASVALPYCAAFASEDARGLCVDRVLWYLRDVHGWDADRLDAECSAHGGTLADLCLDRRAAHDSFWARFWRWFL